MSLNQTIPLCSCGFLLRNESVTLGDVPFFMKGLPLAGSLPRLLDPSYDSKSLSDDMKLGILNKNILTSVSSFYIL